jgi:predicted NBD/HSP70 family sugar kinase
MPSVPANSAGQLFQLFRRGEVRTRTEVQAATGMARSTVTFRVDALLAAGYLVEDGVTSEPGRGRPATVLRVNDRETTVLLADLGATHGRVAVCTAAGDVLAEEVIESSIGEGPAVVLDRVHTLFQKLLADSGRTSDSLRGVGIGVPGPVDQTTGRIARSISMPGWDDYPVADHLTDLVGVPVIVDNDANLLGLGEQAAVYPDAHLMLFVKVGTGIGASILVDGRLVRGRHAAEGDIGHVKIGGDEVCSCGATGCLAAAASGRAMVRDLNRLGHQLRTSRDVVALVRRGDPDAVRIVRESGRALGSVLSTAVSLLNPEVVVIGGDMAHAHEHLLGGVRETLLTQTQPLATADLLVVPSRLQDHAGIAGAALAVRERIFSADAVDRALAVD